jgi:hypothetical protein
MTFNLKSIRRMEFGTYQIDLQSDSGQRLEATAQVSGGGANEDPETVNFESDLVWKEVLHGRLQIRPLCEAIVRFHRAQPEAAAGAS